jgi:hypothetical protein
MDYFDKSLWQIYNLQIIKQLLFSKLSIFNPESDDEGRDTGKFAAGEG